MTNPLQDEIDRLRAQAAEVIAAWRYVSWWAQDSNWDGMHRAVRALAAALAAASPVGTDNPTKEKSE